MWIKLLFGRKARREQAMCAKEEDNRRVLRDDAFLFARFLGGQEYCLRIEECIWKWFSCEKEIDEASDFHAVVVWMRRKEEWRKNRSKSLAAGHWLASFEEKKNTHTFRELNRDRTAIFPTPRAPYLWINRKKSSKKRITPAIISMHQMVVVSFFLSLHDVECVRILSTRLNV